MKDKNDIIHTRTIIAIDNDPFIIKAGENPPNLFYQGGDIAICKLNKPLPKSIKGYNISRNLKNNGYEIVTPVKSGKFSTANLEHYDGDKVAYFKSQNRKPILDYGDSGLPWFIWEDKEWKVVSHTHRGLVGYGPWYGHPLIYDDLMSRIKKLQ